MCVCVCVCVVRELPWLNVEKGLNIFNTNLNFDIFGLIEKYLTYITA